MKPHLYLICFFILATACHRKPPIYHHWYGGYVDKFGTYIGDTTARKLVVSETDGILSYQLYENNKLLIQQDERASIYQNWFLYLDKQQNLWVASADIGLWVWLKEAGHYRKVDDGRVPKGLIMPRQFYNSLPESFKRNN